MLVPLTLALVTGMASQPELEAARRATALAQVREINAAIAVYRVQHRNRCPSSIDELLRKQLVPNPLQDPWKQPFRLARRTCSAFSLGPDQKAGTPDDIHERR